VGAELFDGGIPGRIGLGFEGNGDGTLIGGGRLPLPKRLLPFIFEIGIENP
jgi:hypothetical protein